MIHEPLIEGGSLVRVIGGSGLAVEGVPGSKRGLVVHSALSSANGDRYSRGRYQLTQRVIAGTDLWRVKRLAALTVAS